MIKFKRSIVLPERAAELSKAEVYVISCGVAGCPCDQSGDTCERGFFSLFIQAIYGIDFAERHKLAYHIDFGNKRYCYSDPQQEDPNLWNYYFEQPLAKRPTHLTTTVNQFHELYPILVWHHRHFRRMNHHVRKLVFQRDVIKHVDAARDAIKTNTLGVHVRRTDHADRVLPVELTSYYKVIDKHIGKFDMLFLSTDDHRVVEDFRKRYGAKVHVNDVTRSNDINAVHLNFKYHHKRLLGLEVLTDCLCLANCSKLVLTFSNVSYGALLFNPEIPYILLEKPPVTWRRYKTLTVYFLDKWGIRKW